MRNRSSQKTVFSVVIIFLLILAFGYSQQKQLISTYQRQFSRVVTDRFGQNLVVFPNQSGYFNRPTAKLPPRLVDLLIKKEDRFFYWHPGANPFSLVQAGFGYLGLGQRRASSTITQQLVKILLMHENERNLANKIQETLLAVDLEIFQSKPTILGMYADSIYFGNQAQGIQTASRLYFNKDPATLAEAEILQLLATISSPSENNPVRSPNREIASSLAQRFVPNLAQAVRGSDEPSDQFVVPGQIRKNMDQASFVDPASFELGPWLKDDLAIQRLTLDKELNTKIRDVVQRNIEALKLRDARNAAVVVLKLPENEILSLIGSVDPASQEPGDQIDMLKEPRPIGSTIKPFIYLKAFEKGLRPYTLVDDREYKYITAQGFPLYPKNYDYQYRGRVSLHFALANSLNVPSVKTLEYLGLNDFYRFWDEKMGFKPIQPWNNYQLGIALGGLEMSLLDLARYFTLFPNGGYLKDLQLFSIGSSSVASKVAEPGYVQLVNKILSDRKTGVEQFGLKSELNLFQTNYGLKTGTSRDFRDSWVVGFTPNFLVGVWVGNADNSSTDQVSGQQGAGLIFSEVMELLFNSQYNLQTPFDFGLIKEFQNDGSLEYGLAGDDYQQIKNALLMLDQSLILLPHDNDSFLLEPNTRIILKASQEAGSPEYPRGIDWFIDNEFLGRGPEQIFIPQSPGQYQIKAQSPTVQEEVSISILGE